MTTSEQRVFNDLTPKERATILELMKGGTNGQIGKSLGNSEQVIKNRLRTVFDKTGMGNRTELAMFFRDHPDLLDAMRGIAPGALDAVTLRGFSTEVKRQAAIGQRVFYIPTKQEAMDFNDGTSPMPAVIVAVFDDGSVNLKVQANGPRDFWRRRVPEQTLPEQQGCFRW